MELYGASQWCNLANSGGKGVATIVAKYYSYLSSYDVDSHHCLILLCLQVGVLGGWVCSPTVLVASNCEWVNYKIVQ